MVGTNDELRRARPAKLLDGVRLDGAVEKTWGSVYSVRVKAREHLWELLGIATGLRKTLLERQR